MRCITGDLTCESQQQNSATQLLEDNSAQASSSLVKTPVEPDLTTIHYEECKYIISLETDQLDRRLGKHELIQRCKVENLGHGILNEVGDEKTRNGRKDRGKQRLRWKGPRSQEEDESRLK
ncbi:hypothetical protein BDQ12DRAFT_690653 [Crucibulum laeve]|uniref:Uncharacterized protein n=1 Tax=Crucibulum laeve TaxID=68775 RepID=A0A5C3LP06_9AGAR|nr:hypothetical protein BDQ12DRAFT_690653 [Crucibulum laeve]